MATVRYVLVKMKPGVSTEEYEKFEREVDYAIAGRLKTFRATRCASACASSATIAASATRR